MYISTTTPTPYGSWEGMPTLPADMCYMYICASTCLLCTQVQQQNLVTPQALAGHTADMQVCAHGPAVHSSDSSKSRL